MSAELAFKRYSHPDKAARALMRSQALGAAGLRTPQAWRDRDERVVKFARIHGQSGRSVVNNISATTLNPIMRALHQLHQIPPPVGVDTHNVLTRILHRADLAKGNDMVEVCQAIADQINHERTDRTPRLLHGDFHVGQLIRDNAGRFWIIDFDDLAFGDVESDLGNFAAHLATSTITEDPGQRDRFEAWLDVTLATYQRAGANPDWALATQYGVLSMVRRGLKLASSGESCVLRQLSRWLLM